MQLNSEHQNWRAGRLLNIGKRKRLNLTENPGIKILDIVTYVLEVFPSEPISQHMRLVVYEGMNHDDEDMAFIAKISFLDDIKLMPVEMKLKSLRNGVYAHESLFPKDLICLRKTPEETVLASLNNAWEKRHWCPFY